MCVFVCFIAIPPLEIWKAACFEQVQNAGHYHSLLAVGYRSLGSTVLQWLACCLIARRASV